MKKSGWIFEFYIYTCGYKNNSLNEATLTKPCKHIQKIYILSQNYMYIEQLF